MIFRSEGSVRTRLFSYGFGVLVGARGVADLDIEEVDRVDLDMAAEGTLVPGSNDCVIKVLEVSTFDSSVLMLSQIISIISSSFRKLTSRFVGWTLTSTLCGSISRLRYTNGWPPLGRKME